MITTRYQLLLVLVFTFALVHVSYSQECRFSKLYTQQSLLDDAQDRVDFLNNVLHWEGNFCKDGAGLNALTGYTYDGRTIDYTTGQLTSPLHNFSAPSKESIHLGMAALAVMGINSYGNNPLDFFHVQVNQSEQEKTLFPESLLGANTTNLFTILYRKIQTYETFNAQYPGYGGFFPWVTVSDAGIWPIEGYWSERVPGLDNGEMIWGMMGLISALNHTAAGSSYPAAYQLLATRYQAYMNLLKANAKAVFYNEPGYISAVVHIGNTSAQPTTDNYKNDCDCYLDDPYEGELLTVFMDLYSQWDSISERDQLWINKRNLLQNATFSTPSGDITVQRGWWFSSHEQWKYLMLPYLDVPINRMVFENGERARTWFSHLKQYPGMFASVNNVTKFPSLYPNYMSAAGIQEISFESIECNDVVTPYGSFPLFLVEDLELVGGIAWYYNMISGPAMQNQYGSTESISNQGDEIAPILTWDSKITTVLAMMGGLSNLNRQVMSADGTLVRFLQVIQREWSLKFPEPLQGTDLPFMYPSTQIPHILNDFTTSNQSITNNNRSKSHNNIIIDYLSISYFLFPFFHFTSLGSFSPFIQRLIQFTTRAIHPI
ncbi:hypothetical protein DFA_11577 [Cavenderia fasciculata]|uniref:Endo-beta-1,2-glucanase SGL domain-containing protein n=1 Tax=Cavenderia fasciculata TaxID=261658 RepID=F4QDL9_CACFS|nr:uncharacterized protein DFA_11577 [Cavenderia fasciculata]EGG13816.1 hypothetical protein DFA_11577 [Cavenderia fasciculata]|eukprot:XP_004350524.1 hypothetical protein DFA_11577 [Cavenderia fasciculata]